MTIDIDLPSPAALRAALASIVDSWDDLIIHETPEYWFYDAESTEAQAFNYLSLHFMRRDVHLVAHALGTTSRTANRWIQRWLHRGIISNTTERDRFYKLICLDDYDGLYGKLYFRRKIKSNN